MKALIGYDGSPCADVAVELAASLPWPAGSTLRVVAAVDMSQFETIYFPIGPQNIQEMFEKQRQLDDHRVTVAAERLERDGVTVEHAVVPGRPSRVLSSEAASMHADVIIVGSRGRGGFMTTMVGSVSAETIDLATVPVLVARSDKVERVLAADDGSDAAAHAIDCLRRWPVLAGLTVDVLSVVPHIEAWDDVAAAAAGAPIDDPSRASPIRRHHFEIAERTVRRLRASGHRAELIVAQGQPARQIVDIACQQRSDLIVMGSRGYTGFERVLLGSATRRVLTHAHCSVLVVHPPRTD